jgi:uncharacterized protein (TIGR02246 family)
MGKDLRHEIEKVGAAYVDNFNRQNAAGIAGLYVDGGVHINPAGPRTDIEQLYQAIFSAGFDHQETRVDEAWALGPNAAAALGQYRITGMDKAGNPLESAGLWTAAYVREQEGWRIKIQTAIPRSIPK